MYIYRKYMHLTKKNVEHVHMHINQYQLALSYVNNIVMSYQPPQTSP